MNRRNLLKRITIDKNILCGKPVISGTRISVELILEKLANGLSVKEITEEYGIQEQDVRAALIYAQKTIANEEVFEVI
ncbi:hypothetical protein Tph_c02060 [Thermacetogenium phaeum DSM 12270]|uniref:DUF433 domain-containing protein n=1 Tax=Thermacetogenium phaeum (strain ATCC BAA-254 / DSM 26808 / PB) TaxID=1089553 RepID=K4LCI3_THEPS|nr:DUF433 domain-containing protein [Thermacetogenium phaeum]AFV10453.1 hypothetical protein Tph_c02060 [Thermacetogenium phaeum DSM 12270]